MSSKQQETKAEPQPAQTESPESSPAAQESEAAAASDASGAGDKGADRASKHGADAARVAALEAELASLREELSSVNDKYLRKLADDVNFRKRMAREKEDGQRYAVAALLGDLIPILDDFDRAIASAETQKDYGVLHDGVSIIRRQFGSILESKYGLKKFNALGQAFDPNLHEAVAMIQDESGECEEAVVAEEFLPGYGLHDRILRSAKVRVRMPSPASQAAPKAGGAPGQGAGEASPAGAPEAGAADKKEN